jgi:hypothetical protein
LLPQILDALQRCGTSSHGSIVLQAKIGEEVGIVVLDVRNQIAAANNLVFNHIHPPYAPFHRRLDVDTPIKRVECNHPTSATDGLLPRHDERSQHEEQRSHCETAREDPRAPCASGKCERRERRRNKVSGG